MYNVIMITYYVSGASGHLGHNVIYEIKSYHQKHLNEDYQIVVFSLPNDKYLDFGEDLNKKITIVYGNILNKDDCLKFLSTSKGDKNFLIHLAGLISIYKKKDDKVYNVNINGTKNLLDASLLNKIDKFIYISSVDAIKKPPKNELVKEPTTFNENDVKGVYGKSKAIATNLVLSYNNLGLKTLTIHPSALFGPYDYFKGPINRALSQFYNNKLKIIVTGAYDIVDARDVAKGIINSIYLGKENNSYILSGYHIEIKDLINLSSKLLNKPSYLLCIPSSAVKLVAPILELHTKIHHIKPLFTAYSMDCLHQNSNYSYKKAHDELNYSPRELNESLLDTFNWIKNQNWKN